MGDMIQENLNEGSIRLTFQSDWKIPLRADLLDHFRSIPKEERKLYGEGRVPHFSYLPKGASSRIFVRQIFRGGMLRFLGNFHLGFRRVEKEVRAVSKALDASIPVPSIIATRAERIFGPFYKLTVILEEIPDAKPVLQKVEDLTNIDRRRALEQVGQIIRKMHDEAIYHIDLNVQNILLDEDLKPYIIDLDKALTLESPDQQKGTAVLARLTRSVEKVHLPLSQAERVRFLRAYLGESKGIKALSKACSGTLWIHRWGWSLFGEA
jgi:tRNA A-37 threonylcarbamoyl transferase component Bud32